MGQEPIFVSLDADHQGALLVTLNKYHNYLMMHMEGITDNFNPEHVINWADTIYMVGNLEGRCLHNYLTQEDVDLIELWREELDKEDS